jgi:3-oxoacyl-[acyl-carrier-protein] synthase II
MKHNNIVISGIGTVSPLGKSLEEVSAALASPPASTEVQSWEFHTFDSPVSCRKITDFDPVAILGKKGLRNKDDATKLLLSAAELGFKEYLESSSEESRAGLCVGTAFGSVQSIGDFLSDSIVNGVNSVNPQLFANTVINAPTGNANIRYLARNLSTTISTGFNSGIDALIYAYDHLQQGYLDQIVTGGLDEISYYSLLGMQRSGVLSPTGSVRPFAADSDGTITGEGCALFMLENEASALDRGAEIYASITGCANGFDPACSGKVLAEVITNACTMAGIAATDIDFVASGGSGSPAGDRHEAAGIAAIFGATTPVTAYKSFTGECFGASGALAVICALADIRQDRISGIPAERYETIAPIGMVFGTVKKESTNVLLTSASCDGNCSALILRKIN